MVKKVFAPLLALSLFISFSLAHYLGCTKTMTEHSPDISSKEMIITTGIGSIEFTVEIADTAQERAVGLMGRKSPLKNHGMLFIFDDFDDHAFWMKDTHIPLDIIFFDDKLKVVGIIENTVPESLEMLKIGKNSRYALEVLGGSAKKYGINLHTTARLR